ncbi:MAG: FAD-binding oxidoreductase [Candidatus Peribacteraceae bacterium]|nr:FAD-binding oxidoreductase [Candidatus Peribacteraceae bacterium]MDD5742102.1 FAD-binding oxidoreductase [Candidatus Peribacteraceae bacterium]
MPLTTFTARCTGHRQIAHDVFEFTLAKPEGFSFQAGQFVMFQVPLVDKSSDVQNRAFSIASAPSEPELLFVAKIKQGGRAGRWISELLKEEDDVTFQGPLGNFTLAESGESKLLFLATCSGIAPLRSQIVEALQQGDSRPMDLIFCVRGEEDLFWTKELEAIAQAHPNVHVHVSLSRPSAGWKGLSGHVQDVALEVIADLPERSIYVCGAPEMVKSVRAKAQEEWNILKERVHSEDYV